MNRNKYRASPESNVVNHTKPQVATQLWREQMIAEKVVHGRNEAGGRGLGLFSANYIIVSGRDAGYDSASACGETELTIFGPVPSPLGRDPPLFIYRLGSNNSCL